MSEDTHKMRYEIRLQRELDGMLNSLVIDARELLDEWVQASEQGQKWDIGPTQMSNLLNVCAETDGVEAVVAYVQYQIGRDRDKKDRKKATWALEKPGDGTTFGDALIERLRRHRDQAESAVNRALEQSECTSESRDVEIDRAWIRLVRQYVGHLRRYFVYLRKG